MWKNSFRTIKGSFLVKVKNITQRLARRHAVRQSWPPVPKSGVSKLHFFPHLKPLLLPDWTSVGAAGIKHRAQQFNTNKRLLVKQGSS